MFNHHSLIPWGSFRGRQEEKLGSFWGWDHFGVNLGIISGLWIISGAVQILITDKSTSMQSPSRSGPFQYLIKLVFLTIVAKYVVIRVNLQHTTCALKIPLWKALEFFATVWTYLVGHFPFVIPLSFNSETTSFGLAVSLAGSRLWKWNFCSWEHLNISHSFYVRVV